MICNFVCVKKDIESAEDIKVLVNSFYNHVKRDRIIGHIFNDVAKIDWNKHLPKMYSFWETVILQEGNYKGNTLGVHLNLNKIFPLKEEHFDHWLILFKTTVDEFFEGPGAQQAKNKADSIATVIRIKIHKLKSTPQQ